MFRQYMPDYSKCVIYRIQHVTKPDLLYVGCTTNFNARRHQHKSRCTNVNDVEHNAYKYKMIRENGGWEMFEMKAVKQVSCNNKLEAEIEEEKVRLELKATLNTLIRPLPTPSIPSIPQKPSKPFLSIPMKQYTIADLVDL
jgi:predicted GIY-YIG superfamily endonuclease